MRRAGARGHAPQRGRPPSPFPGRPEGLTCSPPAPGASSQVCAAGSPRVPLPGALPGGLTPLSRGNPPTPPLTPAGPLRWQKRGRLTFFPRQPPEPRARGRPQLEQPQRMWFRVPESRPRPARSGRAAASAGLRATRSGRREVSGLRSAACGPVSAHTQAPGARPSWRLQRQPAESGASVTGLPGDVPKRGLVALTWSRVQP